MASCSCHVSVLLRLANLSIVRLVLSHYFISGSTCYTTQMFPEQECKTVGTKAFLLGVILKFAESLIACLRARS
jgi:hypothetical protein